MTELTRQRPPKSQTGVWATLRQNLFSSPLDALITLAFGYLIYVTVPPLVNWLFVDATFTGTGREACTGSGACWVYISSRFNQFIYGFYPVAEQWRVNIVFAYFAGLILMMILPTFQRKYTIVAIGWAILPILAFILLSGGYFGLPIVQTHKWGGLLVTLVIATVGIVVSMPIGVVLALGRISELPAVRTASILFIELWRGVPLITVLFMASVMLPLFLPEDTSFDKLLRCLIGVVLFTGAYVAEVVRGGLQAIPKGQFEAADALGLGYWQGMGLIVLPQALKKVIPGLMNSFIALFKDTTLVLIVGMYDLLGIVQASLQSGEWLGFTDEGYFFVAVVFWVFCYAMSHYSQKLERQLKTTH